MKRKIGKSVFKSPVKLDVKKPKTVPMFVEGYWLTRMLKGEANVEFRDSRILRYKPKIGDRTFLMSGMRSVYATIQDLKTGSLNQVTKQAKEWMPTFNIEKGKKDLRGFYPKSKIFVVFKVKILPETLHDRRKK